MNLIETLNLMVLLNTNNISVYAPLTPTYGIGFDFNIWIIPQSLTTGIYTVAFTYSDTRPVQQLRVVDLQNEWQYSLAFTDYPSFDAFSPYPQFDSELHLRIL
jgi:hypothetical protein